MAADVQGQYVGFIGDRGNGRHPVPFILPPQNAWAWTKLKFLNERNNFENHFEERGNWDQLWTTGADDDTLTEKTLPRLLALPSFIAEYIQAQGGTCLPYHLYVYIRDHLNGDTTIDPERWRLILEWCITAAQEKNDSSLLNIETPEPALCQDPEFLDWCERRLNFTLGEEVRAATVTQRGGGGGVCDLHLVEQISKNMGHSFLAGVQALTPTIAGAARQGGGTKDDHEVGGRLYSENNVAALKGYCGVVSPADIPPIWDAFQQTKELASHRHNIRTGMQKWSKQKGLDINKAPFFTESSIKDIVGLNFNPGEAVPTFSSAQRGISILICWPKTAQEVEKIKDYEDARRETAHTAQFNEVRRRQKTQPSPPPDTYHELRYSINTFCALLWTLFGDECDYYKGMLEIAETLD